jgi:hypothetical protein
VTEEKPAELEQDVAQHADELEHQADDMQRRSSDLADDISDARDDWERKRRDPAVPGAPEPEEDTGDSPADAVSATAETKRAG